MNEWVNKWTNEWKASNIVWSLNIFQRLTCKRFGGQPTGLELLGGGAYSDLLHYKFLPTLNCATVGLNQWDKRYICIHHKGLVNRDFKYYHMGLRHDTLINSGSLPEYFRHSPSTALCFAHNNIANQFLILLVNPVNAEVSELEKGSTTQRESNIRSYFIW